MPIKSVSGARLITLKVAATEAGPFIDCGDWTESNDREVTSDPEYDRDAYGEGRNPLPAQFEQNDMELTRTFQLPRDRSLLRTFTALAARSGGGYAEVQDQYLEPGSGAAFDDAIITRGQIMGWTYSGANINEPNGKATLQVTIATGGLPTV